jgi:hypothetical protein
MKRRPLWLAIAAFVLALIVLLPVRWLAPALPPPLQCHQWRGSIWHGQCQGLTVLQNDQPVLQANLLRWKLHPAALLRLRLRATIYVRNDQGTGTGVVELGRGGRLRVQDVAATAILDRRLATMLPSGWSGQLTARQLNLTLVNERLEALSGEITLRDFTDGRGASFGSYELGFPDAGPPFTGKLIDAGGPLAIAATVTISVERRWQINGTITPRPDAPQSLRSRLDFLGAPDTAGGYPLSLEGLFK